MRVLHYLFSVIEHHATYLHYDFRVLFAVSRALSFAMSLGPSMVPNLPRLATEMHIHSKASMFSEKTIPEGRYGAGRRHVWDKGVLTTDGDILISLEEGCVNLFLRGNILKGNFEFKIGSDGHREWTLTKFDDEYADPKFVLVPALQISMLSANEERPSKPRSALVQPTLF